MEFEVEAFDSAAAQVNKIVQEEGGYVSSTDSEKLPNGKVKGTLAVRVPPDRLDTLILKLRALGDLKTQKIAAQDVTKVYYDLESELKAARAMEERLLNIIKTGKGEIKDLIEAEKQLGNYREKIEKLEGEVRYYNNLVSLSTLKITLSEKDIKSAAFASQSESVSMGIETDDVEKARADAIKAIEEAKGRVVESNLKKFDAGQLAATIVCEIAPDASGPLIDRLKQLGRIARLDIDRKQTTPSGSTGAPPPTRIDKKDTRFSISIYNLANIAPRQTTVLNLAVTNVEDAYKSILDAVKARNGRVVSSALNRQKPEQTTGSISFEVPSADADATLAELRRERDVLSLTVTENPDTNNVTTAKRGFSVVITSLATVPPRETETQVIATNARVADAYRAILDALKKADARILVSQLNQQDASNVNGQLDFEVLRTREADVRQAISAQADLISRSSARSSDAENTVDSKIRISVKLLSIDRISPRETFTLGIAAKDVPLSYRTLLSALHDHGSRVIQSQLNEQDVQNITGLLDFEVVREKRPAVEKAIKDAGFVYSRVVAKVADTQSSVDTKVRIVVNFMNLDRIAPREIVTMRVQVPNIDSATATLLKTSDSASARIVESTQSKAGPGESSSHIVLECPLAGADTLRQQLKDLGTVQFLETARNIQSPDGEIARTRFDISLLSPDVSRSMGGAIRNGWEVAFRGLMYSLSLIVIGILFVAPWALAIFGAVRLFRRRKTAPISAA